MDFEENEKVFLRSNKILRVPSHESLLWLFFCVDNVPLQDKIKSSACQNISAHISLFAQKRNQVSPQNGVPLYFSFLCSLLFSCHYFSFLFLPFVTHCPHSQVALPSPPYFHCLLHGSQHIMSVGMWVCPPFSFCPTGGAWSSAAPDNLIRVMESCDRL